MPIVFVHGVGVRNSDPGTLAYWDEIKVFLRQVVAPEITDDPEHVAIMYAYWGDVAASLAWEGASRPRTPLFGMGAAPAALSAFERAVVTASLQEALQDLPESQTPANAYGGLAAAGPGSTPSGVSSPERLKDFSPQQLSDLAVTIIQDLSTDPRQRAYIALAADAVAHDPTTFPQLARCFDRQAEIALFQQMIKARYEQETGLAGQGTPNWLSDFGERLGESLDRAVDLPGFVATRVLAEARKPLNDLVTHFLEDVFFYLADRGNAEHPGAIPLRILQYLAEARENQKQRGGEPLIVLTHSMGGQLVYELVTSFLPHLPQYADIRIDFWCATASQVGFFEELKLFLASSPAYSLSQHNLVPFPDRRHLGAWWNVWDDNDFISFTAHAIIAGVDDASYNSGMSVLGAHGGYLERPSFFREFAQKLREAKAENWSRP